MKRLNWEEFNDRLLALDRARKIFIETGLTKNLSIAFEAYQAVFAERERELFLTAQTAPEGIGKLHRKFDQYERPKCPDCDADMMFRQVPENPEGIKTQLVCSKCDVVLNDRNDIQWWMENLRKKDGSEGISEGSEKVEQAG